MKLQKRSKYMLFSVILPVYNVEKYLRQCIDSILCQTFTDYEVILVDDGSTDTSGAICDEYGNEYQNIKVVHKENGGQASARNCGLKEANGEYILFLDSDDFIISQDAFENISKNLQGTDILCFRHIDFYDSTQSFGKSRYDYSEICSVGNVEKILIELIKKDAYYGTAWGKAIKSSVLIDNNIQFDINLSCEDMDWFYNVVMCVESITLLNQAYIAYRQRDNSVTKMLKTKNLNDFVMTLEKWSNISTALPETKIDKRNVLLASMAKYYSNLLIVYIRVKEKSKKKYKSRIKDLSYLLDWGLSSRPKQIKKIYKLLGFDGVVTMLKIYDKIK